VVRRRAYAENQNTKLHDGMIKSRSTKIGDWIIVGIGINCAQTGEDFPEDLRSMAGSLAMVSGTDISRAKVAAAMMEALYAMSCTLFSGKFAMLRQYRKDCMTLGQDISILRGNEVRHGHALDIDDEGALIVRLADGTVETVNSGEVSVRGMYGYL
jgi:BirA family biotin operon repressor/biotin-[acetyl-CoA-carboxylase] ligase